MICPFQVNGFGYAKNAKGNPDGFGQRDRLSVLEAKRLVVVLDLNRDAANAKVVKHQEFDSAILPPGCDLGPDRDRRSVKSDICQRGFAHFYKGTLARFVGGL